MGGQIFLGGQAQGKSGWDVLDPMNILHKKKSPFDLSDRPDITVPYVQGFDPGSMSMTPEMEARLSKINADPRGMAAFREQALQTGPSTWERMAGAQESQRAAQQRNLLGQTSRAGLAEAQSQAAMRGGLGGGSQERLARGAQANLLGQQAALGGASAGRLLDISARGEAERSARLQALPGMEIQALQPEFQKTSMWQTSRSADIQRAIEEARAKQAAAQATAQGGLQAWAAGKQAQATENAGKK